MSVAQSIYPFGLGPGPLRFMNGIGEKKLWIQNRVISDIFQCSVSHPSKINSSLALKVEALAIIEICIFFNP